jgi:hypothetical protein
MLDIFNVILPIIVVFAVTARHVSRVARHVSRVAWHMPANLELDITTVTIFDVIPL